MSVLRASVASELKRILHERGLTVTEAAKSLEISRQALYNYLNELSTPRARVLSKAMELWGLEIRVGQTVFNSDSFEKATPARPVPVSTRPEQLDLWRQLDAINEDNLRIGVKRVGKTLRVSVQIEIPA
jgi:transcriptional regulator with XRE-family HTH domain